jgi:uncharacterized paraquat-inducible protein A
VVQILRGDALPYEICPVCHLTTYSATLRSVIDVECPRCGAALDRSSAERQAPSTRRLVDHCRVWLDALPRRQSGHRA